MKFSLFDGSGKDGRPSAGLARSGPLLALVVAGFLAEAVNHEEAYAGIDYGLSLLMLLGAAGCTVRLAERFSAGFYPLPGAGLLPPVPRPCAALPGETVVGKDWPLLVALLFGPFVVLTSGLGGWV